MFSRLTPADRKPSRWLFPAVVLVVALVATALTLISVAPADASAPEPRWFQIDGDMLRTDAGHIANQPEFLASYLQLIRNAATYGYDGVILRSNELNVLGPAGRGTDTGWVEAVETISAEARANGLDVIMSYGSIGRCARLLAANNRPDLAAAYPVTMNMDMNAGVLTPTGGFSTPTSLAGTSITGNGSVQARVTGLELGGQYRVTVELAGDLNVGKVRLRVVDGADNTGSGQILNSLELVASPSRPDNLIAMAFNSFRSTDVRVFVEASGRQNSPGAVVNVVSYSVEAVPTLNGVNRGGMVGDQDAVAVDVMNNGAVVDTFTLGDGLSYRNAAGERIPRDENLGTWDATVNSWSARQTPPELRINTRRLPASYDQLVFRAWHALPFKKVVSCSWNDPALHTLISRVALHAHRLGATGHLLPFDEINTGGAEPADGLGANTAQAMADSIAGVVGAVRGMVGSTKPIYIFSDMIDENTNARPCYEHVKGSLANPPAVPAGVTVLTWDESGPGDQHFIRRDDTCFPRRADSSFDVSVHRTAGLTNIASLADTQIIAAYYDTDLVAQDHADWQDAIAAMPTNNVKGVVYAAWTPPTACPGYAHGSGPYDCSTTPCKTNLETTGCVYEHLEEFANLWWGDEDNPTCRGRTPTLTGTSGDDELRGTSGRDVIWAGPGNDTIFGFDGNDIICTGTGDDLVYGGGDNDLVFGDAGSNRIFGGPGNDVLVGGYNADGLWGGPGDDRLVGSHGDDALAGGPGSDQLFGAPGRDELSGGDGNDFLNGGPGSPDVCDGDLGLDTHTGQCEIQLSIP